MAHPTAEPREVNARIAYWGAQGAGKSTNLRVIHAKLRPDHRGRLEQVPTALDPSVTYEMLPIELGELGGVRTRIQIVGMPGGPEHATTRKQLLDGVEGIVFVVDTRNECLQDNLAAFEELRQSLAAYGRDVADVPLVVQYNKRDLAEAYNLEELHHKLDLSGAAAFEAVATQGLAVLPTLTTISKSVVRKLREIGVAARSGEPATPESPLTASPGTREPSPSSTPATPIPETEIEPAPSPAATRILAAAPGATQILQPLELAPAVELEPETLLESEVENDEDALSELIPESAGDPIPESLAELAPEPEGAPAVERLPDASLAATLITEVGHPDAEIVAATAAEAQTLLDPNFDEIVGEFDDPGAPAISGSGELEIERMGPPELVGKRSVRIPLVLRDADGRALPLTLTVQIDPHGPEDDH